MLALSQRVFFCPSCVFFVVVCFEYLLFVESNVKIMGFALLGFMGSVCNDVVFVGGMLLAVLVFMMLEMSD